MVAEPAEFIAGGGESSAFFEEEREEGVFVGGFEEG